MEPDYLRRVNSVEVLFQEDTDPSDKTPDSNDISFDNYDGNVTYRKPRRKRSSQVSIARSLSVDSVASPGLAIGSSSLCASPTASSTFLSRRTSRSASRNPALPAESPTKRAFPPITPHSPITEHVDYPILQNSVQSGIISVPKGGGKRLDEVHSDADPSKSLTSLIPNPAPPVSHPVSLPPPFTVHEPSTQVSVSSSLTRSYQGQSSGETYDHLYDSDPSRSDSSNTNTHSRVRKLSSGNEVCNGTQHQTKTDGKQPQPTRKWVVPVAVATIGIGAALVASYYFLRRKS